MGVPVTVLHYPVINYATFGPSLLFFVRKAQKGLKRVGRWGGVSIYIYIYMYRYIRHVGLGPGEPSYHRDKKRGTEFRELVT